MTKHHTHFGGSADDATPVDVDELRTEVRAKYGAVAVEPNAEYHFHTGRFIADRCGYEAEILDTLPTEAIESFAGVASPFALRRIERRERVLDLGSGAGLDCFVAGRMTGPAGHVTGVDMTQQMLGKARQTAEQIGDTHVEFREGFLEDLPMEDESVDVVISNGVINLCPDKTAVFEEIWRVLKPGGVLQFADIANGNPVPAEAQRHIDLWTG